MTSGSTEVAGDTAASRENASADVELRAPRRVRVGEMVDVAVEVTHGDSPLRAVAVNWDDGADDTNEVSQSLDFIECEQGAPVPPQATEGHPG